MNHFKNITLTAVIFISFITISCFEDRDDNGTFASEISDFVWKGMNFWYLYKENIPDLANDKFSSSEQYTDYLNVFSEPEELFESLIYQPQTIDKYSRILNDYIAFEQLLQGCASRSGYEIDFYLEPGSNTNIYGVVRLVLPGSNAESAGLQRGQLFNGVDGVQLNNDNINSLFSSDNYMLDLALYDDNGTPETTDDLIIEEGTSINLSKSPFCENPIFTSRILNVEGDNIAYLMYNGFVSDYNNELNTIFADYKNSNVQHLVLDLRYNPGGSVNTSILLASLITGQFTGEIHSTEQWNDDIQTAFFNQNPENLINRFTNSLNGSPINSLFLDKVYVLTTGDSASASELIINTLNPYINVIQIGTTTEGKYQGSITLYDSDDFQREGANPNHTYAMQPLVLKLANAAGFTDYSNGIGPTIMLSENPQNYGVLGDENEPLLARALLDISMNNSPIWSEDILLPYSTSNQFESYSNEMYIDKFIPKDIIKRLKFNK